MVALADRACEACHADSPKVSADDASTLLDELPGWRIVDTPQLRLVGEFRFPNFVAALAFANRVGELAEAEDHHPELVVEWGRVQVSWWTHAIGGLHMNDFVLAARTSSLNA